MATTCAAASLPFVIPTWLSLVSIVIVASTAFLGAFGGVRLALRADRQSKSENNESTRDFQHGNSEGALSRVDSSQSSTQPAPEVSLESAQPRVHNEETTTDVGDAGGLPTAFVCCITSELFLNPVVASDGHSYERAAIEKWFERHNTSPSTGERLHSKEVIPNHNLRSQVLEYRRAEGLPDPPPWVPTEPTEAPAATTAAADAESSSPTTASTSGPTANVAGAAGAGGATPRQFRINIPQAEATALLASIRQVLDRSPALLAEMGLAQVGATNFPSENEQAAARILADPRLLSLVARHAAGTSGLEPLAPRLTRAAHSISQLLANEMQAQRVAQHQAPASQPIRPVPQGLAAANAAPTSAAMASGGSGASGGLVPPDDPPLHRAARAGDCGAVQRELLALQRTQPHLFASPTPRSGPGSGNGSSPSQQQHWATADRPRDRFGESLLAVACQHGHLDLVRMLTSPAFGANPALPSLRGGTTPLHHAARTAHSGILQCLLDALKALSSEGHGNTSTTALASALKARNHAGETPLHAAAGRRIGTFGLGGASNNSPAEDSSAAVAACTALLAAGADVSAVTENGCSALHLAALVPGRSGVAELLLREGALPDAQEFVKHSTPVHHAAQSGDPLMLHAILGHVQRDATKRASEARASSSGGGDEDSDAVEAAGRAASSVLANQAGKRGLVPLHCAAASGSALAVRALVSDYGARLDARGELDGASPLTVWNILVLKSSLNPCTPS